jgi:Abortive infection alpha
MSTSWIQVAQEALKIPGLLVEIYGDLAKPGVQQTGKALSTVIGLGNTVLWPIQWANERSRIYLEKNLQDYRERLKDIPADEIVVVAPEIGVPIAEKLSYVSDKKLADLYITLLTTASKSNTVSEAHPSFVNVINNLSPDEAQILEYFVSKNNIEYVTAIWEGPSVYSIAGELIVLNELSKNLIYSQNTSAYFSNLVGLGIASIHSDRTPFDSLVYPQIEVECREKFPAQMSPSPDRVLAFKRGIISITTFGRQFINACHNSPN